MKGVDISHYQKGLTIRQIRDAGCGFVIIKVTEGTGLKDEAAFAFYCEAYESGFPVGCYSYSHALTPGQARSEAQFLLDTINGFPMPCGIFLDMEEPGQLGLAKEKLTAIVSAWCGSIRKAGYVPGIYSSEYGVWAKLDQAALPDGCLVWVAHYGKEPQIPYDLWQSGNNGRIGGVTVDTDEARSERFERIVERGFSAPPQPPEGETALSVLLERLGAYIRTREFKQGFLDYLQRTEAEDDE